MSQSSTPSGLDQLIGHAHGELEAQRKAMEAKVAARPTRSRTKVIATILLSALCAGMIFHQWSRFQEPYALPDPETDQVVVHVDIDAIAAAVESHRIATGTYPTDLGQVRLPAGLDELALHHGMVYSTQDDAFRIEWRLPSWHAVYDSANGVLNVSKASDRQ